MAFDIKKFQGSEFRPRTKEVPVPELREFFDKKEKPVFVLRNLTGEEIFKAGAAVKRAQNLEEVVKQIASEVTKEKVKGILDALGLGADSIPDEYIIRLRMLKFGCVEPVLDLEDCKKIATCFSSTFTKLTNEINVLSGLGSSLGESKPSGTTPKSK